MKNLIEINKKLLKINKKLFIVGGYNREKILNGIYSGDIDLSTDATPEKMKKILNVVTEVGKKYGTLIIKEGKETFEITTFRKDIGILDNRKPVKVEFTDDLILDSTRRDFTFNAIYFNIKNNDFIDPQNGIIDIKNKIIRFIGNPEDRINEDALRILRFIRFKNKYNFDNGEENYFDILKNNINLLKNISIERIKDEFDKILLLENNVQALKDLKEIGFFGILIPEIDVLDNVLGGPSHHLEGNVWIHTLMTISELNNIFKNGINKININYNDQEKIDFYWTILLHDIGKYETYSKDKNGKVHYYNHEEISVKMTKEILKKYKFSTKSTKKTLWLIKNHLRIFKVIDMRLLKSRKFMMHEFFKDLIIIGISDHRGRIPSNENLIIKLLEFYNNFLKILKTKIFLTGKDILLKYPKLKGVEIKNKLNILNDKILVK